MTVKVYSNCNNVVLYVNGTEFQSKISEDKVFIFENVSLVKGLNDIRAVATEDNAQYVDIAKFSKVEEPNPSYEAPVEEKAAKLRTGSKCLIWMERSRNYSSRTMFILRVARLKSFSRIKMRLWS